MYVNIICRYYYIIINIASFILYKCIWCDGKKLYNFTWSLISLPARIDKFALFVYKYIVVCAALWLQAHERKGDTFYYNGQIFIFEPFFFFLTLTELEKNVIVSNARKFIFRSNNIYNWICLHHSRASQIKFKFIWFAYIMLPIYILCLY